MAQRFAWIMLSLGLVAGCQHQATSLDALPHPSFDPPNIRSQPAQREVVAMRPPPPVRPVRPAPPPVTNLPREWVPAAAARNWQWIVVHHSATATGGAAAFDRMHKAKGWDELGYHFVIGNNSDTADGQVEVGSRWTRQKWGAHTKTPDNRFNDYGIGICLVGNFDDTRPTAAQMRSLARLTGHLMRTYRIPADHVVGHRDCKSTDCPGRHVSLAEIRRLAAQYAGLDGDGPVRAAANISRP